MDESILGMAGVDDTAPAGQKEVHEGTGEPAGQHEPDGETYLTAEEILEAHKEGRAIDRKRLAPEHKVFYESLENDFKRHSTKTWQEAAEARRQADELRQQYEHAIQTARNPKEQKRQELFQALVRDEYSVMAEIDSNMDQLDDYLRNPGISEEEYHQAMQNRRELRELKKDLMGRKAEYIRNETMRQSVGQQLQSAVSEYNNDVKKDIPDFGDAKIAELRAFGKTIGLTDHDYLMGDPTTMIVVNTPNGPQIRPLGDIAARVTKALYKAMLSKNPSSAIRNFAAEPPLPPVGKGAVGDRRPRDSGLYPDDPAEFARRRNKELHGR